MHKECNKSWEKYCHKTTQFCTVNEPQGCKYIHILCPPTSCPPLTASVCRYFLSKQGRLYNTGSANSPIPLSDFDVQIKEKHMRHDKMPRLPVSHMRDR